MTERAYRKLMRLASGGMGTVHVGVLEGALGFRQLVALKEAHPHLLEDSQIRRTLVEEATLAARIHHANVVEVRDVLVQGEGITLVMPYVEGASLAELWARGAETREMPIGVALRIVLDACAGLAAAHALTDEAGTPLGLVHRDVSPQNLLVGVDGVTRVTDFGVAKHRRSDGYSTTHGTFKGKLAYAAPEYLRGQGIDARLDVFALAVVLWELLARERLFYAEGELETIERVQRHRPRKLGAVRAELAPIDEVLARALEKSKAARTATMAEFQTELEAASRGLVASHREVAALVAEIMGPRLEERRAALRELLRAAGAPPSDSSLASLPPLSSPNTQTLADVPIAAPRRSRVLVAVGVIAVALGVTVAVRSVASRAPTTTTAKAPEPPKSAVSIATPTIVTPPLVSAAPSASVPETAAPSAAPSVRPPATVRPSGVKRPPSGPPEPPPNPYGR